jgi:hypothetical protein
MVADPYGRGLLLPLPPIYADWADGLKPIRTTEESYLAESAIEADSALQKENRVQERNPAYEKIAAGNK